jgi:hypothetical protein
MGTEMLEIMLVNLPNFTGFAVGIVLMWRVVTRLLDYIQSDCDCGRHGERESTNE